MHKSVRRSAAVSALIFAACGGAATSTPHPAALPPSAANALRSPADFASIADREARSRAMFVEASRVMLHPRCKNCHPAGDTPMQGESPIPHDPPVLRGEDNEGLPGLRCGGCHQDRNLELARVPGAPKWQLAPREMAWFDKDPHSLCEQIKDPARNGKKTLAQIVEHSGHDPLVAWGWAPGHGRVPAPGTQAQFGALMDAWVKEGAVCP
jgi:hypothetical protein